MNSAIHIFHRFTGVGIAGLILAAHLAFVAGCQRVRTDAALPNLVQVSAEGYVDPATVAPRAAAVAGDDLTSAAVVVHDGSIADTGQRVLAARAAARRQALRGIGEQLQHLRAADGRPLLLTLRAADSPAITQLNELLDRHAETTYTEFNGRSKALVLLPAARLNEFLAAAGGAPESSSLPLTAEEDQVLRAQAYEAALRDARKQLRDVIPIVPIEPNGPTIGEVIERRPSLVNELNALMLATQPDTVEYPEPGRCRMTLSFDMGQARELARAAFRQKD